MWYNFYLAFIIWSLIVGIFGTCLCYTCPCNRCKCCLFKCVCCRMAVFYIIFGFICVIHGGLPSLLFFTIFSLVSMCIAKKSARKQIAHIPAKDVNENKEVVETTNGRTTTTINGEKWRRLSSSMDEPSVNNDGEEVTV